MPAPEHLYGIIGYPLGHSLSPLLHSWGFARTGWPGAYFAWPVPPADTADFIRAARLLPVHGASVTIPHKESVLPLLDSVSPRAARMGAVNTLFWRDGALCGENTDVHGFMAPLRARMTSACGDAAKRAIFESALVLGAGGAARAVIAGLQELGVPRIHIANRHPGKAEILARHFGVETLPWEERAALGAQCVVNTTPLGMHGAHAEDSPFPVAGFTGDGLAYDLVYNPLHTRFLRDARAAGWAVQDGLDMFAAQGVEQFRIWTGRALPVRDAREMLLQHLRAESPSPLQQKH